MTRVATPPSRMLPSTPPGRLAGSCLLLTAALATAVGLGAGCSSEESQTEPPKSLSLEELKDPASCQGCHESQYRSWASSMHAYAADDPVFLAMNARGQRETNGQLGDFCVRCHAPMALRDKATTDGQNLPSLPASQRGVTCYFCHNVTEVAGTHNNPLKLAGDRLLRGGIENPVSNPAHHGGYSAIHDRNQAASSAMCGACHDVVLPNGYHLERTLKEFSGSIYASSDPLQALSCGRCHMPSVTGKVANLDKVPQRRVHDHRMAAVDVALTPWPDETGQKAAAQAELDNVLSSVLCVKPSPGGVTIEVTLDNVSVGHHFPSGAAHDRRVWAEVIALTGGQVTYSAGQIGANEAVAESKDPDLWAFFDRAFKTDGTAAHMFWDVAYVESNLMGVTVTLDSTDPRFVHAVSRDFRVFSGVPDEVHLKVHMRPIGLEVIDDLVQSGDLDTAIKAKLPTYTLASATRTWKRSDGFRCFPDE